MFNLSTSLEQKNRERQDLKIVSPEPELDTDLYSEGYFVGYIGAEPTKPEDSSYWAGYQLGCREYWSIELGVEIPSHI